MYEPDFANPSWSETGPTQDDEDDYESDKYYDEQGREMQEVDYSKVDFADGSFPAPPKPKRVLRNTEVSKGKDGNDSGSTPSLPKRERCCPIEDSLLPHPGYTMDDMNPTIRDPRCSSNTDLACFWPVYVSNFRGYHDTEMAGKVSSYFASRGLHVRWSFNRTDQYYREFQMKAGLYDMLVYFVSERDANLAIERCHRDTFQGYTMNVFPGREPVYFDPNRSVYAEKMKSGRIFSEHFFEKHVKHVCNVKVDCVVKFDMKNGALEFGSPDDVAIAQKKERMWTYLPVKGKMQKQRFLEKDLIDRIETYLARNPDALKPKNDKNMKLLLQGKRRYYDPNKHYRVKPLRRGPSKRTQQKRFKKKQENRIKYGFK